MFRTSNPAFSRNESFSPAQTWDDVRGQGHNAPREVETGGQTSGGRSMTVQGTVNKTALLLAMCVTTAVCGWNIATSAEPIINPALMTFGSAILGLLISLVVIFAPKTSPVTAPMYALVEGFFVGGISAFYAQRFGAKEDDMLNTGLIFNAALLTFGILGGLLLGYTTRLIRPGPVFRNCVIAGTIGVCLYGLVAMVASMFGSFSLASVYDPSNGGLVSVGFSLLLVGLASANLVLDFEYIETAAGQRSPKYMEWYGGFGLLVTLVWLYIEVLRLLAKLRSSE